MEEERVKKGAKGKPSTSLSYSGSEFESDEMKMAVDSKNEDKSSAAENTAKDDGQEEVEEEEEEEEEEESDEEEEDDEEEEEESDDDDDDIGVNKKRSKKIAILESESSDDGEGDDCPICLNRLKYQDIGTPEACDHNFCLDCIQLWARNVNTCPVDRREFQLILARHAKEDEIFKRIPVSGKSLQNEDDDTDVNEDFTYCELCGRSDREDRLLLCDGCDLGFHCECLDPPLDSVPVEEWFCPDCAEANTQRSSRMLNDLDDMQYLLEENSIDGIPYLRPRRRQIARTRISERVRARIQEYREGLARLVCDDEPGASDEEGEGPSTRLSRTRSQTRQSEAKRKPPRRKRTKKGRAGKQKAYPKKKLRRRTKAPGKAQLFDKLRNANTSKSPKSRLAGKLGLTKARTSLRKSDRVTAAQIVKEDLYGPKPLTITGGKHDLDPFPDDDSYNRSDEPQASTSVFSAAAAKRASKYSASALLSRQPVARPLLCKLPEDNPGSNFFSGHCSNSGGSNAASSSGGGGGLDLLGSIMMDQNILNLESKDVKINRDGSLTAKKAVTASAVKEPKNKKFHLFIDSKDDENSSVHMDSDNERSSDDSKVAASTGCPSSERNNDSSSQVEDDKKENSDPKEEPMESDTDLKCSDAEMRDSDNETKPSTIESGNEMSVPANQDDDDDEDQEEAEKKDGEDVEDSFESNEADKSVEKENEDGSSHDGLTEVGLDSQNSEMNDENVSPEKESIDQANNSEEEGEKGCEVRNNMEEEDVGDEDEEICKDEQKDDVSEHEGEEENDEEQQEDKAASERGSSGFSPVEKSSDADPQSDVEPASFQKEEEEFLSDEENGGKDASMSVEKMDDSAEISESVHDEQRAASDADDTEDDVTGKEDEDSVKSDAEEASKDVDEADPKSDAEAKDTEMVKSDAEELDAEMTAKSDAEELDAEMTAQSDAEELDAEMTAKSDAENLNPEMTVKSDDEDLDPGLAAKSDAGDLDPEVAGKSDDDDLEPEVAGKSDDDDLEREAAVKSDDDDLEPEVTVKSDGDDDDLEPEVAVKSDDDDDLEPEVAVKSDDDDDLEPETAAKSDAEDLEPETAVKSDDDDLEPETAVKSDDDDLEPETAAKSDAEDLEPETAVKSDDDDLEPETAAKSDAEDLEPETAAKSDAEDFEPEMAIKSDADDLEPGMFKSDTDDLEPGMFKSDTDDLDLETAIKSDPEDLEPEMMFKSDTDDLDPEMMVKSDADDLDTEEPENETSLLVKSDQEEEDVQEETEVSEDVNKFVPEDDDNSPETMQDDMLPSESDRTEEQEFPKVEESDDNGENLATENLADQIYEDKDGKLEVADEASENFDDAASKDSDGMVKTHEELETFEEQNEVCDEVGSESEMESAGNEEEEEEEEDELQEKPKIPISELPRIPKRSRREGYRRERGSKGDGPELKSVLGRVDLPEYKMGRTWEKKDSRRNRWDPDEWSQSERDIDCAGNRDKKSEGSKGYHSDHSESSKGSSEKYTFEYKESKSRKRRRDRSRSRSRGHKDSIVEYRDIPHRRHSPERSKSRRRDRSRNRSRSGSREKSFDYDKSHKRKSRGRSRDRSQSRKSRRHRSYSRSPSRKRDKERSSTDKRRHREERKRGEERSHKRHSDKSDPEESRKKRHIHEDYDEWEDGSCQVVEFDESTSPKGAAGKKSAGCFYGSPSSNEKVNENFFNRRTLHEKGAFKGDKMDESAFYNARGSNKKHKYVDRFYKAPHLRHTGTEKFPIDLSEEDEGDEHTGRSRSSRLDDSGRERDTAGQDSGDSEYDPAFPTESGSPLRGRANREGRKPPEESSAPVAVTTAAPTLKTSAAAVKTTSAAAAAEEIASSGSVDETPPTGSQGILGESGFMMSENPNMQNMPMQPQNLSFPMGIRMMPPGMQPGMQQHLLMNPMFLNRPPPFGRLPRMSGPMGRLGWSVNPSGIMQIPPNRFGHARMGPGGGMPPRPGLLNGGFEGMSQEPGQQMPPFKQHPCDPRNIPSHTAGHQGPPGQIPRHHMPHLPPHGPLLPHPPPPPPSSQQMHIPPPTSDTLSSSSLDSHLQHGLGKGQPSSDEKSASSNFCVPELNQISKLIEAHAQALQNKQRNPASQGSDIDVFKIPLPPMAPPSIPPPTMGLPIVPPLETHTYTSTSKSYKNGQSRLLANSHSLTELVSESTEVVDMDVASPLDDEVAIELPASPELDDIDESKINMKDSAVIELTVPEDMPASAVELTNLTNKEKHTSRVKKSNPKASQQRTASPTSTKTSYMGYMKKLQIQERVVDEVKLAIKPFYSGKKIDKDEYKEILRKAVPKICHSKSGNINPAKIKALIEAYVDKMCKTRRYMERKKKLSLKANGERLKKPSR